jgi:hypothetical protein
MNSITKSILLGALVFLIIPLQAKERFQTIRGVITDKDNNMPLVGVTVTISETNPMIGTTSDSNGEFVLNQVPIGRQTLRFNYVGYKPTTLSNIEVNSGKEVVLPVAMEEMVTTLQEVAIIGQRNKTQAMNEMNSISSRTFSVEETGRYAGSRNDVSRMASNYAGVANNDDSRNDIIIRGNSPMGLLWRLEELEIPGPNHFTGVGSSGGPVSMLNYNVIANSDFMTGAFPAEYGNATSGVFDIKLRNGNNQKHEYITQAGALGTEMMVEGPFANDYKGSYLLNYRFSTTSILTAMNIKFGYSGKANYQDIAYNFNMPVGSRFSISFFGMGGNSIYTALYKDKKEADFNPDGMIPTNNRYLSATGAMGASLTYHFSENSFFKTIIGFTGVSENGNEDSVDVNTLNALPRYRANNFQYKLTFHSYVKSKISARIKIKTGVIIDRYTYQIHAKFGKMSDGQLAFQRMGNGNAILLQVYTQSIYNLTDDFSFNGGLHYQFLELNSDHTIEPRAGLKWAFKPGQSISLGYGLHAQMQVLPLYMVSTQTKQGLVNTNKNLKFSKSHQFVAGYSNMIAKGTALKIEAYYQRLFDIPVTNQNSRSSFSSVNEGMSFIQTDKDSLVNKGTGRNYGIEVTLERFFNKGFYYLTTLSLYDSKYKGSDGILRNTAFNGHYVANVLVGKEFNLNDRSKFLFDIKVTTSGGKRYTPIDKEASETAKEAVRIDDQAFSKQFTNYFRTDIKLTYRFNGLGKAHEVFVNIDNVFNNKNVFAQTYDAGKNELTYIYQLGIFPTFQYKLYF